MYFQDVFKEHGLICGQDKKGNTLLAMLSPAAITEGPSLSELSFLSSDLILF